MPEIVGVTSIVVKVLNGGGFVVSTLYADGFENVKATDSVGKMKKRLKVAVEEMVEDTKMKGA